MLARRRARAAPSPDGACATAICAAAEHVACSPVRLAIVCSTSARTVSDASKLGDDTRYSTSRPSTSPAIGSATYDAAEPRSLGSASARRAATSAHDAAFDAVERTAPWLQLPDSPGFYDVQPDWKSPHAIAFGQVRLFMPTHIQANAHTCLQSRCRLQTFTRHSAPCLWRASACQMHEGSAG